MKVEVINKDFTLEIYGFSGVAINKDYSRTAIHLMDKMWQIVKAKELKHKGLNIWVYEPNEKIFAGVELYDSLEYDSGLEHKVVSLSKYAYYKHFGQYNLIKKSGDKVREELRNLGFETIFPYVEIYGHWTNEETKLETELLFCLK